MMVFQIKVNEALYQKLLKLHYISTHTKQKTENQGRQKFSHNTRLPNPEA